MHTQHTWSDLEHHVQIPLSQLEDLEPVTAEPKGEKAITSTCEYVRGDQSVYMCWIIEKARKFQKNIYFCFIDYAKAFDCVDHNTLENSERDGNTRPPDLPLEKPVCMSGSNS